MKRAWLFAWLLVGTGLLGCNRSTLQVQAGLDVVDSVPLRELLQANYQASGASAWEQIRQVRAEAIATINDGKAGITLVRQDYELDLTSPPALRVESQMPDGIWVEKLDRKGKVDVKPGENAVDRGDDDLGRRGAQLKLRLLVQALTQTAGLLRDDFEINVRQAEHRGGRVWRVATVSGPLAVSGRGQDGVVADQMKVWFDAGSKLIDRIWLPYRKPDGSMDYLAANVMSYETLDSGIVLPHYIGIVRSDVHAQFSERELFRVEFQRFEVE